MNIFKLLFELFIFYLLYKLIVDFIIPVYRTSKRMKDQVSQMQQKMKEQQQRQNFQDDAFLKNNSLKSTPGKVAGKDYIEFEEL